MRLRGGEPLPEGVTLPLAARERVLTWGRLDDGGYAAATDHGLRVSGDAQPAIHRWHEIEHARWTDDAVLDVEPVDGAPVRYRFVEPRGVPAAVREQVTLSVPVSERHRLDETHGVRIVARRNPADGKVTWSALLDPGVDADDPLVRERAEAILVAVRRRAGG